MMSRNQELTCLFAAATFRRETKRLTNKRILALVNLWTFLFLEIDFDTPLLTIVGTSFFVFFSIWNYSITL